MERKIKAVNFLDELPNDGDSIVLIRNGHDIKQTIFKSENLIQGEQDEEKYCFYEIDEYLSYFEEDGLVPYCQTSFYYLWLPREIFNQTIGEELDSNELQIPSWWAPKKNSI